MKPPNVLPPPRTSRLSPLVPDCLGSLLEGPSLVPLDRPLGHYLGLADRIVGAGIAAEERDMIARRAGRAVEDIADLEYTAWSRDPDEVFCVLVQADPGTPDDLDRLEDLCTLLRRRPRIYIFALAASAPEDWRIEVRALGADDGVITGA